MVKALRIRLFGEEYHLLGTLETGGPIATVEQYTHGRPSFAHYYPPDEGDVISRHGVQIGSRADIEVLGEVERETPADDALSNIIEEFFGT